MDGSARKLDTDGTQEILNERLTALMGHLTETHGHYLQGWEMDFIKLTVRDRARFQVNNVGYFIESEPATIICSIYNRLATECRL